MSAKQQALKNMKMKVLCEQWSHLRSSSTKPIRNLTKFTTTNTNQFKDQAHQKEKDQLIQQLQQDPRKSSNNLSNSNQSKMRFTPGAKMKTRSKQFSRHQCSKSTNKKVGSDSMKQQVNHMKAQFTNHFLNISSKMVGLTLFL